MTARAQSNLTSRMRVFRTRKTSRVKAFAKSFCYFLPLISGLAIAIAASASDALPTTVDICDQAAQTASAESGVPLSVLWSITRSETGRNQNGKLRPWPWTVNMEGAGHWFGTEEAARSFVLKHFKRGARSFDVGCFQINYKWHGASFRSIEHMFDPLENARYAAAFLRRLYRESGDWSVAAGAYHSRTPEHANRYIARFDRIRRQHENINDVPNGSGTHQHELASATGESRQNNYPLLRHSGLSKSRGSLVPMSKGQARALFTIPGMLEGS